MRRLFFLVSLLSILVFPISNAVSSCCQCDRGVINVTPKTGMAPLSVVASGDFFWVFALDVNMGGEAIYEREFVWDDCYACVPFSVQHQFDCPGTYTISVYEHGYPYPSTTTTVTVNPPSTPYLFVYSGNSANEVYLATHYYAAERPFTSVSVDWGDGGAETFAWVPRGLYMGTPYHQYAADGEYTATVTHHYQYQYCSWDQVSTAVVKVPYPTSATRPATWGVVKAMYR